MVCRGLGCRVVVDGGVVVGGGDGGGDDASPLVWWVAGGGDSVPPPAIGDGDGGAQQVCLVVGECLVAVVLRVERAGRFTAWGDLGGRWRMAMSCRQLSGTPPAGEAGRMRLGCGYPPVDTGVVGRCLGYLGAGGNGVAAGGG